MNGWVWRDSAADNFWRTSLSWGVLAGGLSALAGQISAADYPGLSGDEFVALKGQGAVWWVGMRGCPGKLPRGHEDVSACILAALLPVAMFALRVFRAAG